jgi:hypothetical protein
MPLFVLVPMADEVNDVRELAKLWFVVHWRWRKPSECRRVADTRIEMIRASRRGDQE